MSIVFYNFFKKNLNTLFDDIIKEKCEIKMSKISSKFNENLNSILKTRVMFKELIHHQISEQYETVILSNTINSVFLIVDYYSEYDSIDINEISADDIKIIYKFL